MDKVISRRDFIVGGGVFGASMAAVGLAGCAPSNAGLPSTDTDASGTSTHKGADRPLSSRLVEVDEGDVARTEECDVVVCGSGSAGTYAAIRAAELGARVIWLEKTSLKGGTSTITEGTLMRRGPQTCRPSSKLTCSGTIGVLMHQGFGATWTILEKPSIGP